MNRQLARLAGRAERGEDEETASSSRCPLLPSGDGWTWKWFGGCCAAGGPERGGGRCWPAADDAPGQRACWPACWLASEFAPGRRPCRLRGSAQPRGPDWPGLEQGGNGNLPGEVRKPVVLARRQARRSCSSPGSDRGPPPKPDACGNRTSAATPSASIALSRSAASYAVGERRRRCAPRPGRARACAARPQLADGLAVVDPPVPAVALLDAEAHVAVAGRDPRREPCVRLLPAVVVGRDRVDVHGAVPRSS